MAHKASVIIPSLGRVQRLRECVRAITVQSAPWSFEVIVAIDGADSELIGSALASEFRPFPALSVTASKQRRGSPRAKNDGAKMATGEILLFVDDDVVVRDGWLQRIVDGYSDGVVGVGGSEVKTRPPGILRRLWFKLNGNASGRVTRGGQVISNFSAKTLTVQQVDCLAGANMSFRRDEFFRVGGFDEMFGGNAYREETDLCVRLSKNGLLLFQPSAVVDHHEDASGGNSSKDLRDWNYWYHRNNSYFFFKDLYDGSLVHRVRHSAIELALASGRSLSQRSLTPLTTMRKGHRDGRKTFSETGVRK